MKKITVLTLLITLLSCTTGLAEEFELIINKSNQTASLLRTDIKNIFLGKKSTWPDGTPVVLITQRDSETTEAFTLSILNKSPQQFSTYWKKALFTGTGIPPKKASNDSEMIELVAGRTGAIGYISNTATSDRINVLSVR